MIKYIALLRTAISVLILALIMLIALYMCLAWKVDADYFDKAATTLWIMAGIIAGKSLGEKLGNGGGVGGMVKALFTESKPNPTDKP